MNSKRIMRYSLPLALMALCCLASCMMNTVHASNQLSERELQGRFTTWMREHARSYSSDDFMKRYNVWRENADFIEAFNADETQTFTVAMNEYGDLTPEEFAAQYKGFRMSAEEQQDLHRRLVEEAAADVPSIQPRSAIPSTWDWRTKGAVTAVKNQGSCAACWAFTATGAIEGARKIAGSSLVSLSDQQLIDCAVGTGNLGCNGGNVEITYRWMISNNARVQLESQYPYTARQSTCRVAPASGVQGIGNLLKVSAGSESDLLTKAAIGPVTVAIDASKRSFMFYSGGYYYESTCSSSYLDHAVLVVGWGSDATHGDYWLVKNQWGTAWGDSGFAYMARNRDNNCGIASLAVLPCIGSTCTTTPNTDGSGVAASPIPVAASITPAAPNASPANTLPVAPSTLPVAPSPQPAQASVVPARSPAAAVSSTPSVPRAASPSPASAQTCYCQCGCASGKPTDICFCPCPCSA